MKWFAVDVQQVLDLQSASQKHHDAPVMWLALRGHAVRVRSPTIHDDEVDAVAGRPPRPRAALAALEACGLLLRHGDSWRFADHVALSRSLSTRSNMFRAFQKLVARDGHACRYCGGRSYLSVDHVLPRVQGGSDELDNLVIACRRCNSRKGGRTPEQASMKLLDVS